MATHYKLIPENQSKAAFYFEPGEGYITHHDGSHTRLDQEPTRLVLAEFCSNPNKVLSKYELFDRVWKGKLDQPIAQPDSVREHIRLIRAALRDSQQTIIINHRGNGYRLACEVEERTFAEKPVSFDEFRLSDAEMRKFYKCIAAAEDYKLPSAVMKLIRAEVGRRQQTALFGQRTAIDQSSRIPVYDLAIDEDGRIYLCERSEEDDGYPPYRETGLVETGLLSIEEFRLSDAELLKWSKCITAKEQYKFPPAVRKMINIELDAEREGDNSRGFKEGEIQYRVLFYRDGKFAKIERRYYRNGKFRLPDSYDIDHYGSLGWGASWEHDFDS